MKNFHYITVVIMVLLIIPSGLNNNFSYLFLIILGLNLINGGVIDYRKKENKNSSYFIIACGIITLLIGLYRLILSSIE